ncbi:MAG: DUF692 domain-containing protein [Mariprofundales bacterium]|nr:DUF692 domain-containing protein [Mariprofundales bacterium]
MAATPKASKRDMVALGVGHPIPDGSIPEQAGIGLRPPHVAHLLTTLPPVPWLEVHSENFFAAGGEMIQLLEQVRAHYPISLHGVGLSLGTAEALYQNHLMQLQALVTRIQPGLVSEHISWGGVGSYHLNALLPLPYTEESLSLMVERVDAAQQRLGRTILVENASTYLEYTHSTIPEWEFVVALAQRAGCELLLDVNNIYVNSVNHNFDPLTFIDAVPAALVAEIHLAGFSRKEGLPVPLLIDSHDHPVYPEVWHLYQQTIDRIGRQPTLIEWDAHIPDFAVLQGEANKAEEIMNAA